MVLQPRIGKWERRTERERIGGTNSRRADFDESRLAKDYIAKDDGLAMLGKFQTRLLSLDVKKGVDVAFPRIKIWVDQGTGNVLKRQEFALSGRLLRTSYYPRWKSSTVNPKVETFGTRKRSVSSTRWKKGNSTLVLMKAIDLRPLPKNVFTKAWLESKTR